MDASYSWHPGTGRVKSRWAVSVPLLPDELFSSWVVRAAFSQGCSPLVFTGELWPKWRFWTTDPDRVLSEERLRVLADASGIQVSAFAAASMRSISAAVTDSSLNDLSIWPWILALGSRNRKRHGGLQYCPTCLNNDGKPYYRLQWRLTWHTCCSQHGLALLDQCPACKAPIEPHRLSELDVHIGLCATCKSDLRDVVAQPIDSDAFAFQRFTDNVVKQNNGLYGTHSLASQEWFALSRYFIMLLRRVAMGKSDRLTSFVKGLGLNVDAIAPPATGLALELLPVDERAKLLAGTWKLLQVGPERFLEAAKATSLSVQSLRENSKPIPMQLQNIVYSLPDNSGSRTSRGKNNIPNPRSRQAVMRMCARLKRKYEAASR